jgi:hypothetical protein
MPSTNQITYEDAVMNASSDEDELFNLLIEQLSRCPYEGSCYLSLSAFTKLVKNAFDLGEVVDYTNLISRVYCGVRDRAFPRGKSDDEF